MMIENRGRISNPYDINLRDKAFIFIEFEELGNDLQTIEFHRSFKWEARRVIQHYGMWKSKEEVVQELKKLGQEPHFIERLFLDGEAGYNDFLKAIPKLLIGSEECRLFTDQISENEERYAHVFPNVCITKELETYDYFFAWTLDSLQPKYMLEFLEYHFLNEFDSNINEYSQFLILMMHENGHFLGDGNDKLIKSWLDTKLKSERPFTKQQSDRVKTDGFKVPDGPYILDGCVNEKSCTYFEIIVKGLSHFFSVDEVKELTNLLQGRCINKPLNFKGSLADLCRIMGQLNQSKILTGSKTDIRDWIYKNFRSKDGSVFNRGTIKGKLERKKEFDSHPVYAITKLVKEHGEIDQNFAKR